MGGGVVTPDRRRTLGRRRSSQISYRYFLRETFLFVVLFFFCWFVLFLRMTKRSTPRRPFGFSEAVDSRGLWALSLSLSLSLSASKEARGGRLHNSTCSKLCGFLLEPTERKANPAG